MLKKGDQVVYPSNGIGVVQDIEKILLNNENNLCYLIFIPKQNLKISVPIDHALKIGVRLVTTKSSLKDLLKESYDPSKNFDLNSNRKYAYNLKSNSGEIKNLLELTRDLECASLFKVRLKPVELIFMRSAREELIKELMATLDCSKKEAEALLQKDIQTKIKELNIKPSRDAQ
ncbi:CarD family transcriptional regulator [Alkalicoccobacillus murimartini]|uniref:CarD family transcriptional regulator n=1 Tax=Alkalicoccobacillus murimartini TaxID=171685 RepID=A0ABT9YKG4_9BACI|nr:CarD family transcriptional regulator [Alkalicoccobacillus murimartini]MDQ0208343.1 CarD family transcriptional regulator [Alkalicoccobacillus murimartini]